jgi:CRISPR-associated protein Cas1
MEEFRPIISDFVVLSVINNVEITPGDFIARGGAVALTPLTRKTFLAAYGRRMDTQIPYPFSAIRSPTGVCWRYKPGYWPDT